MTMASILDSHFFHGLKPLEKLYQKPLRIHLKRINNLEIYWDYWATNTTATFIILFLMVGTSFLVTIAIRLPCIYSSILRFAALTPGASAPALITSVSSSVSSASSRFFGCRNRPSQPEPFRDGRGFGNGREGTPRFFSYGVVGGWFSVVS